MSEVKPKKAKENPERPAPILTRRDLLKIGGATTGAVVLTEFVMKGPLSAEAIQGIGSQTHPGVGSAEQEWHMAIDLNKCIGCYYCVRACQAVNNVADPNMRWNIVFPEMNDEGTEFFMNRPCQHCADAPCVRVCPVGATWIRPDGIVAMDYDRCIGCRYCQVACPYDVRRFNWDVPSADNMFQPEWGSPEVDLRPRGVVEKCTFCVHRIDRAVELGLKPGVDKAVTPACVAICPVSARVFGDIKDSESPVSKFLAENDTFRIREDWGTNPRVHYVAPRKEEA